MKKGVFFTPLFWLSVMSVLSLIIISSLKARTKSFNPLNYLGTKSPYNSIPSPHEPLSLKHCTPVHINHLGRHGSRHLTKSLNEEFVLIIERAYQQRKLKQDAERLAGMLKAIRRLESPVKIGQLTLQGQVEQQAIARRLFTSFGNVLTKDKKIIMESTYIKRTKDSLDAFKQGLIAIKPELLGNIEINEKSNSTLCDPHLRFFAGCKNYEKFIDNKPYEEQINTAWSLRGEPKLINLLQRIFEKPFLRSLSTKEQALVYENLYHLCQLEADINKEQIEQGFCSFFNEQELALLNWKDDLVHYFSKADTSYNKNSKLMACALVSDFINSSNKAIHDKDAPSGHFRFAHAETIIPFLMSLGLYNQDKPQGILLNHDREFKSSLIAPMSAHVQWILYRCPHEYRLRMRHNERDIAFPIKGCQKDSCSFELIKDHYRKTGRACDINTWATTICGGTHCHISMPDRSS